MEKTRTQLYEAMLILRPTLSDDAKEKAMQKITSLIESLGGKSEKVLDWGRKKLAYEIKGSREGHYYLLYFELPTSSINEWIRENHLNEDLLRFMHMCVEQVPEGDEVNFKSLAMVER